MAQGHWDKTGLVAGGAMPSFAYTFASNSNATFSLVEHPLAITNPVFKIEHLIDRESAYVIFKDAAPSDTWELLIRHQYLVDNRSSDFGTKILALVLDQAAIATSLRCQMWPSHDGIRLSVLDPFTSLIEGVTSGNTQPGQWQWMRFRVEPTGVTDEYSLKASGWGGRVSDEPLDVNGDPAWQVEATTVNGGLSAGYPAISTRQQGQVCWIDQIAWANAGERAVFPDLNLTTPPELRSELVDGAANLGWSEVTDAPAYEYELRKV